MHPATVEPVLAPSSPSSWQSDAAVADRPAPTEIQSQAANLPGKLRTILLMSHDALMAGKLRAAADLEQCAVAWVSETFSLFKMCKASRPAAVLLDLDMHTGAAWEAADRLLSEPNCPPLVLLTARVNHPEFSTAGQSGYVVDKFTAPSRLMQIVDETIEAPPSVRDERTAVQRIMVLRLNPFHPAQYRDFGIND